MSNFGESLAYWYLRLNGFFPITNFVLHREQGQQAQIGQPNADTQQAQGRKYSADADLLGVRFPHVREIIDSTVQRYDETFPREIDEELLTEQDKTKLRTICLIVEVKTDGCSAEDLRKSFSENRLNTAIQRFGVFPHEQAQAIAHDLLATKSLIRGNYVFAKLALLEKEAPAANDLHFIVRSLNHANHFVYQRLFDSIEDKDADKVFFFDPFIQYIIWTAKHSLQNNTHGYPLQNLPDF
jgi:hypothetical protein